MGRKRVERTKEWCLERIQVDPDSGCWLWTGHLSSAGYGRTCIWRDGAWRTTGAYRVTYELWVGPIPAGLTIDHQCRVRRCVNPSHLKPMTQRENCLAPGSQSLGKLNSLKTHCPKGHPYTPENTLKQRSRTRICKQCRRDKDELSSRMRIAIRAGWGVFPPVEGETE